MTAAVAIPLTAGVVAAVMASAILANDPGQRANRLVALVLACSVHWSLCELLWNLSSDPEIVIWLLRLSAAGWLWLGPLCLEIYVEVAGDGRSRLRRLVPLAYTTSAVGLALYLTPWCVRNPVPTHWGWNYSFGPLFAIAYLPTVVWVSVVLVQWPSVFSRTESARERNQALGMFFGIGIPMAVSAVTDVLLPHLGVPAPRLGSASIVVVGLVVVWSIHRYGYFLMAPGAFTHEILETLRDGVALVGIDGRIRQSNGGLARLCGLSPEALADHSIFELLPKLPVDPECPSSDLELELVAASGPGVPVSVSSSVLIGDGSVVVGRVLVVRDLREVANLRNRLVTSGRLAAVGELAAGIAMEITDPIVYVRSNLVALGRAWGALESEAIKTECVATLDPLFGEGKELLLESIEGAERIASVVRDVGGISHAGLGESELANVNQLLENAVNVAALSYSVMVERRYAADAQIFCNPQQLKQVFLNLLLNAFEAIGDFGEIRLRTELADAKVVIEVADDGCGIAPDALERIFDPFFTTRPTGEGTGLGLALSYQIIDNHGGEISVESTAGVGTCFRIQLPISRALSSSS